LTATTREVTDNTNQPDLPSNSNPDSSSENENSNASQQIMSDSEVVGIDPGTTTAVVALDVDGNIIATKSERHMAFEEITRFLIERGRPVLVAADKAKVPGLIEKTAATFGALAYSPKEDLGQEEKKQLIDGFEGNFDSHTEDALAAAHHAWDNYHNLFLRVKKRVKGENLGGNFDDVLIQVIKQSRPIKKAIKNVQNREQKKIEPDNNRKRDSKQQRDKRWWRKRSRKLSLELDRADSKIDNLEEYNQQLKQEKEELKDKLADLESKEEERRQQIIKQEEVKKRTDLVRRKNKQIERLEKELNDNQKKVNGLKQIITKLKQGWNSVTVVSSPQELEEVEDGIILLETPISAQDVKQITINKQLEAVIVADGGDKQLTDALESQGVKVINKDNVELVCWAGVCAVNPQTLESEKRGFISWIKQYKQERGQTN